MKCGRAAQLQSTVERECGAFTYEISATASSLIRTEKVEQYQLCGSNLIDLSD
jgi:hypothetical protein